VHWVEQLRVLHLDDTYWAHNLICADLQRGKQTPSALCFSVRVVMCSTPGVKHGEQVAQDKQVAGGGGGGGDDAKHVKQTNGSIQGDTALVNSDSNSYRESCNVYCCILDL